MDKIKKIIEDSKIDGLPKEQYIKITLDKTGENKTEIPGSMHTEITGITDRQALFAAISLFEDVILRYDRRGLSVASFLSKAFVLSELPEGLKDLSDKMKD